MDHRPDEKAVARKAARKKSAAKRATKKAAGNTAAKTSAKGATRKAPPEPSEDPIRALAYELYERRGRVGGSDIDDWLNAERQLRDERHRA